MTPQTPAPDAPINPALDADAVATEARQSSANNRCKSGDGGHAGSAMTMPDLVVCKKCGNTPVRYAFIFDTKTEVFYNCSCDPKAPETQEGKAVRVWNEDNFAPDAEAALTKEQILALIPIERDANAEPDQPGWKNQKHQYNAGFNTAISYMRDRLRRHFAGDTALLDKAASVALEIFTTGQCFEGDFCGTRKTEKVFHFTDEEIRIIQTALLRAPVQGEAERYRNIINPPPQDGCGKINRPAFQSLMDGNLEWLMRQPKSLERDHIAMLIKDAPMMYYQSSTPAPCEWRGVDEDTPKRGRYLGVIEIRKNSFKFGEPFVCEWDEEDGHRCQFQTEQRLHKPTHWRPFDYPSPAKQEPKL